MRVVKKNGERVRFDRERIMQGILRACEKLSVSVETVEDAVANIEAHCQNEYDREVPSTVIGSLVMDELRRIDQVAYVRFASVYREFKDVTQFMQELEGLAESVEEVRPPTDPEDESEKGPDLDDRKDPLSPEDGAGGAS